MQRPDQQKSITQPNDQIDEAALLRAKTASITKSVSLSSSSHHSFDWLTLGVVILIAAFFAFTARLNAQPATSFVPVAVLSATGCGLLVTALRKLHTQKGTGLFVAALGGFFVALFQFIVALTYPGVFNTLILGGPLQQAFLLTWGLIIGFSVLFSAVGAVLGHLAFAPLRPLPPAKSSQHASIEPVEDEEENDTSPGEQLVDHIDVPEDRENGISDSEDEQNTGEMGEQQTTFPIEEDMLEIDSLQPTRSAFNYLVTILLLGLAPIVIGFVFSAAFDFTLGLDQVIPGPYPTLRLLSALLPWQIPIPINLSGTIGSIITFSLLWRIPLFLGNPTTFDLQALEAFAFNGAALALLLLTIQHSSTTRPSSPPRWLTYLLLEAVLGLVLVLPADLWIFQGLNGLLQLPAITIPIRTLSILNPLTFALNLITGPLVCIAIAVVLRRLLNRRARTSLAV
jgi:hypothetical protein